ncbi:DUF6370 family protein [Hymenobacter mucosus]|uniref:Glutaminyl-tRNA synthetase n=1 Tax=Hymenobacter mucosus TaxID=1411120 RepID=A0A238XV65_9BACT|nr:DUF6370 family protein [Hymenobacter mucosus]SNR62946.1 hypothetical protein SAMN06269173_104436 [Hymenobacter mucosus]
MKALLFALVMSTAAVSVGHAQAVQSQPAAPSTPKQVQLVEAACGQCRLGLPGKGCDLAVRMNGKAYFVDGTTIDSHGDAHAQDGFCSAIRTAQVQGEIVDNRFKATYFKLVPETTKSK